MIIVDSSLFSKVMLNRQTLIGLVAATVLVTPVAVSASTTAARTGSFDAMGTGTVIAQGKLRVFGMIDGTVAVRDLAGGAVVKIAGVRQKPRRVMLRGRAQFVYKIKDVDGAFFANGRGLRVELRAPDGTLSISAFGRGTITRMSGEGTYHLNGGDEQSWSTAAMPLAIAPPSKAPNPEPVGPAN